MILFWLLLVGLFIVVVTSLLNSSRDVKRDVEQDPILILEARFARGEIDEREFEQRRAVLIASKQR
ncbi:MAG TPA: SHOCT domain-containing protein [Pseudomonadales bacterium]|nr:SHOCT domain-containing protein [Pseudomonadales bacterium]